MRQTLLLSRLTLALTAAFPLCAPAQRESAAPPPRAEARCETAECVVTGTGWKVSSLADRAQAFANRRYVWESVPTRFQGWRLTQTSGGERAELRVKAKRDMSLFVATAASKRTAAALPGWSSGAGVAFRYTDSGKTLMTVYGRTLKAGDELVVPQLGWTGTLVLLPPDSAPKPQRQVNGGNKEE